MGEAGRAVTPCPTCRKPARREEAAAGEGRVDPYPFCSFRCQMVDLGRWIDEEYRIPDGEDQSGGGADGAPAPGGDDHT